MSFTLDEARALVAAVRLAPPRLDAVLARQAEAALSKTLAVLPPAARAAAESLAMYAPDLGIDKPTRARLEVLRVAAGARRKLHFSYVDAQGRSSTRTVRPLCCFYWDAVWTRAARCENCTDFRRFRVDRIQGLQVLDERFRDETGQTLPELLRSAGLGRTGN